MENAAVVESQSENIIPALSVESLHLSFDETPILKGISLAVKPATSVGIIGPNGSGKTTLFNAISGFCPISGGAIKIGREDVSQLAPHERARKGLGRVFQHYGVFREMTVWENVLVALESAQSGILFPWSRKYRTLRESVREHLAMVGLSEHEHKKAGSLSGGQLRLLEIVRTLAHGAEVFLIDEPTAGVAPKAKHSLLEVMHHLRSLGKTVLIIEHDLEFVYQFVDRVVVLDVGSLVLDGSPAEIRTNPALRKIYFGDNSV